MVAAYIKDTEEGGLFSLPAWSCSYWQIHFFIGIKANFFRIKTTCDIQPHGLNNYWILGLLLMNICVYAYMYACVYVYIMYSQNVCVCAYILSVLFL